MWIASAWVLAVVVFAGWLAEREESKKGVHDHGRVVLIITVAFVVAPFAAGLTHRSRRVGVLVAVFGILGWIASMAYFASVQSSIGGGP